MNLKQKKTIASKLLKCGINRIWFDPEKNQDIQKALTKADVRKLINEKTIKKKQKTGVSRARANKILIQKKKGQRKGPGKKKGKIGTRAKRKTLWIKQIRAIRRELLILKEKNEINKKQYRKLYHLGNAGVLKTRAYTRLYVSKIKT